MPVFIDEPAKSRQACLFIGDISLGGGTERACATLAELLVSAGWHVTVLSLVSGSVSYFDLPAAVRLCQVWQRKVRMRWRIVQTVCRLRQFLKQHKFDAWIDTETALTAYSAAALAGSAVQHIAWENFHLKADLGSRLRRLGRFCAVRWADHVVLLTQADQRDWFARYGKLAKFVVIPHCIQTQGPLPVPVSQRQRAVLAVGRLCHQKGFDLLLRSWARIAADHPSWVLRIVGSGEELEALKTLAAQLGIADCVQWIPATRWVFSQYEAASIYALSSRFEGFGLVLIEAMAQGLPIVSFDCPYGPAEIIEHGKTGQLVPPGDLTAFADALDQLMRHSARREKMASASYAASHPYRKSGNQAQWFALLNGPMLQDQV